MKKKEKKPGKRKALQKSFNVELNPIAQFWNMLLYLYIILYFCMKIWDFIYEL